MDSSFPPLAAYGCQDLTFVEDPASRLRAVVATHHLHGGVAFGGLRRRRYTSPEEAVREVLGLALAMGRKCALAGVPGGGAKAVMLDEDGLDLAAAYGSFGAWIESQGGRYRTGPDVGTGDRELGFLAARTAHVAAPPPLGPEDLPGATVAGILGGLAAVFEEAGEPRFEGRRVVIVGLGKVGGRLASELSGRGAVVLGTDLDPRRVDQAASEAGLLPLAPGVEFETPADALAPCALGGFLGPDLARTMAARALCGGANDPLVHGTEGATTTLLAGRGITFLPDFAVSAGAVLRGAQAALGLAISTLREIEGEIQATCADILHRAREVDRTPHAVACELAEARVAARRGTASPLDPVPNSSVRNAPLFQLDRP